MFTLALEDVTKNLTWERKGININEKFLSHLHFADHIILISADAVELGDMLRELKEVVGLRKNLMKTKMMSSNDIQATVDNHTLEVVAKYVYLGHKIKLGRENQIAEINRRWPLLENFVTPFKTTTSPLI